MTRRELLRHAGAVAAPVIGASLTGCHNVCGGFSDTYYPLKDKLLSGVKLSPEEKQNMLMARAGLVSCVFVTGAGRFAAGEESFPLEQIVTLNETSMVAILSSPLKSTVYAIDNYGVNRVRVLDQTTLAVLADIPFPDGQPVAMALSPDELTLLVSTVVDVAVVDTATRRVTSRLTLPAGVRPLNVVFHPEGATAYVIARPAGSATAATIFEVDLAGRAVTRSLAAPEATGEVVISPDGALLFLTTSSGVSMIDTQTLTVGTNIAIAGRPTHLAIDRAGERLFAGRSIRSTQTGVTIVDTAKAEIAGFASIGAPPDFPIIDGIVVSPDGRFVYTWDNNSTVVQRIRAENAELEARMRVAIPNAIGVFALAIG